MNDLEKLGHLLKHWMEHNEEHARIYLEWASKAGTSGNEELMRVLNKIAEDTKKIEGLFKRAKALLDNSLN